MRVLIAEDDPVSRKVLESTLRKWGYDVTVTCNGQEAWDELQADDVPKLVVLDWMMPKMSGPEICKNIRSMPDGKYFYILLLTAKGTKENIVNGLDAGADDYVIKPFDSRELRVRISCGQRIVDLQTELIAARDKLQIQATHDGLTQVLNRSAIYDALQREQARSVRENIPMTVIMIDLDHFKAINDNFGHASGDIVLKEVTRRMEANSRKYDLIGRYGGEEFILILPHCDNKDGRRQAERLRKSIADKQFNLGALRVPVTASFGVASTDRVKVNDIDDLVMFADKALYVAKNGGRNRVALASDDLTETSVSKMP